jgi:hypothetical protein
LSSRRRFVAPIGTVAAAAVEALAGQPADWSGTVERMAEKVCENPRLARSLRHRAGGPVAALSVYVPPALAVEARVCVARRGTTLSALVTQLLEAHLAAERSA